MKIPIRRVYLDKEFYSLDVFRTLGRRNMAYVIPIPIRGKLGGIRQFFGKKQSRSGTYTMHSTKRHRTYTNRAPTTDTSWQPVTFTIPDWNGYWDQPSENSYNAIGMDDTFIWTEEVYEGDLTLSYDIEILYGNDEWGGRAVILFGDGTGWSKGNLIFFVNGEAQNIQLDTIYDGTVFLAYNTLTLQDNHTYSLTIEILGKKASLFLDGEEIVSATLPTRVNRRGKIRLFKEWAVPEVTFSNIKSGFGIMADDGDDRIVSFLEKPEIVAPEMPDRPGWALASMGIYVFHRDFLHEQLRRDAADPHTRRDFGHDIIPYLVRHGKAGAHRFTASCVRSSAESQVYWREVGTLDAYWKANIDLTDVVPALDLFDRDWPIWTYAEITPPAKFVHDEDGRRGLGFASLVSGGCIISGSVLKHSLLFTGVHVHSYGRLDNAVVLPYAEIGRGVKLTNVIIDAKVKIPDGLVVGVDPELDAARFRRSPQGVCLITQPMIDRLGTVAA